jgi:hydrogenase-4 component B
MPEFLFAILLLPLSGLFAAVSSRSEIGHRVGQAGAIAGSAIGLIPTIRVLVIGKSESVSGIWQMPGGTLHVEIDPLSAFFLLLVFGLSLVTALYGRSYLSASGRRDSTASWFHLNRQQAWRW